MTMKSPLARWEAAQHDQLEELQSRVDQSMLLQLLKTSCLLELSKLNPTELDLGAYTRSVIEVITQFFPAQGCDLRLDVPGLPPMRAGFGARLSEVADTFLARAVLGELAITDGTACGHAIVLNGRLVGLLTVWHLSAGLDPDDLVRAVADQISATLSVLVETERLRRQAAADTAMRLAASLDERSNEEHLEELTAAVAALPGATGASLHVDAPIFNPPVLVIAGLLDGVSMTTSEHDFADEGHFRLVVTWADEPDTGDRASLDDVISTLTTSLNRAERNRRLLEEAETDPLTGIANRRRLSRHLGMSINRAERHGENVAVVAVDLDNFKQVNDRFGHEVGDAVLQAVAEVLRQEVRSYDTPGRTGGDEFLVVLPQADALGAAAFARRVLARIPEECAKHLPSDAVMAVTASIGVAVYPGHAEYLDALLRVADEALYAAKKAGRNRVVVVDRDPAPAA